MRAAGPLLSVAGHAAVIALALWGLPWLRVRPEPPPQAVTVSLVSPTELAALARSAPPATEAPAPEPPPAVAKPPETRVPPRTEPDDRPGGAEPDLPDLAPGFDATAPLGLAAPETAGIPLLDPQPLEQQSPDDTALADVAPPPPRPQSSTAPAPTTEPDVPPAAEPPSAGSAGSAATAGGTEAMSRYEAAVHAAIDRALVMPRVVRDRGLDGTVRVELSIGRDGRLLRVRIATSSGFGPMDAAALAAARRAELPAAPPEVPGGSFRFALDIDFTTTDG